MTDFGIKKEGDFKFVETGGGGNPLVLLHGLFGALSNFEGIIQHFSKTRNVVVPLLPIFEGNLKMPTVTSLVEYVSRFVDMKGFEKAFSLFFFLFLFFLTSRQGTSQNMLPSVLFYPFSFPPRYHPCYFPHFFLPSLYSTLPLLPFLYIFFSFLFWLDRFFFLCVCCFVFLAPAVSHALVIYLLFFSTFSFFLCVFFCEVKCSPLLCIPFCLFIYLFVCVNTCYSIVCLSFFLLSLFDLSVYLCFNLIFSVFSFPLFIHSLFFLSCSFAPHSCHFFFFTILFFFISFPGTPHPLFLFFLSSPSSPTSSSLSHHCLNLSSPLPSPLPHVFTLPCFCSQFFPHSPISFPSPASPSFSPSTITSPWRLCYSPHLAVFSIILT